MTFDDDHPARWAVPSRIAGMPEAGRHDHDEDGSAGRISEDMERRAITAAFPRTEPAIFAEIADHAAWVKADQPSEADEARRSELADGPGLWDRGAAGSAQVALYGRALLDDMPRGEPTVHLLVDLEAGTVTQFVNLQAVAYAAMGLPAACHPAHTLPTGPRGYQHQGRAWGKVDPPALDDPSPTEPPSLLPALPGYDVAGAQARIDAGKGPFRPFRGRLGHR